jgi:hypothetical protein
MAALNDNGVFVPVVPLLLAHGDVIVAANDDDAPAYGTGALLSSSDEKLFLKEQRRSIDEKLSSLAKVRRVCVSAWPQFAALYDVISCV